MQFTKMHGTGNDFVIVDARTLDAGWETLARVMCDRHFGVGSDGLILALPATGADLRMRMFNPDGSEAEMCGNGIRCLAKFAVERGIATPKDGALVVETLAGRLRCEVFGQDGGGTGGAAPDRRGLGNRPGSPSQVERVRVSMGQPHFAPEEIPVIAESSGPVLDLPIGVEGGDFRVTCVSMGNPHAVHFTKQPVAAIDLEHIGPRVEHHPAFPRRVNFEVANVLDRDRLRMRVWERGAGMTLACGTGACATAVAARLHDLVDDAVDVELPGGVVRIEWDGDGEVFLSGSAETVFEGRWTGPVPR
jgi:diaminopimelate epimerase